MEIKINSVLFSIILSFYFFSFIDNKTVVLPFKELKEYKSTEESQEYKPSDFINEQYKLQLYTTIQIGTPRQLMMAVFNTNTNQFIVGDDKKCYIKPEYNYFPSESSSSINVTQIQGYDYYDGYSLINETINIYTDKTLKRLEEVPNFQLYYKDPAKINTTDNSKIYCADFGFQVSYQKDYWAKFVKQLKNAGLINSDLLSMEYSEENGGFFYLGEFPHEYDSKNFKEAQLMQTYSIPRASFPQFRILMSNVTAYNENKIPINLRTKESFFNVELGLIEGPKDYMSFITSVFFQKYIEQKICSLESLYLFDELKSINYFMCEGDDKKIDIKSFPSLNFYHSDFNFTFILDYKDLFKKIKDKYYFLVVFNKLGLDNWKLGKPFLKKYQISLNLDSKIIYFYNKDKEITIDDINNEIENQDKIKNIILIIICVILSIILFGITLYFTKKLQNQRKPRANELADEKYEYSPINA